MAFTFSLFNPSVEAWRSLVDSFNPPGGTNFHLAWIQKESNGNPCNYTQLRESGVYQLMYPDNLAAAGTSEDVTHPVPPCIVQTDSTATIDALSSDQAYAQIQSGIQYVNYAIGYAQALVNWPQDQPDFWRLVKMVHVSPVRVHQFAPTSSSWADFRAQAKATTPQSWLDNAEWVGGYGSSALSTLKVSPVALTLALITGLAVGAWLYDRDALRGIKQRLRGRFQPRAA